MKRLLLAMMIVGNALMLAAQTDPANDEPSFLPPETLSITDIEFPSTSIASGTVVVDAVLSERGKVQTVEVRRGIVSLTEPLVSAVKEWEFSPATVAGKAITSRMPVALTVRPPLWSVVPVPLPALKPQTDAAIQAGFQAAEVIRAAFPSYPGANIVNPVTVVLEVTLGTTGKAEAIKVLRDFPPLTDEAKAALEDWRFMAATLNGRAVESKVVLAFVFRPPISSN